MPSTRGWGDLAHNPGMCPDWELNWRTFGLWARTRSTEPCQPGLDISYADNLLHFALDIKCKVFSRALQGVPAALTDLVSYMQSLMHEILLSTSCVLGAAPDAGRAAVNQTARTRTLSGLLPQAHPPGRPLYCLKLSQRIALFACG